MSSPTPSPPLVTLAILTTFLIAFAPAAFADCKSRAGSTVVFNHGLRPGSSRWDTGPPR